MKIESRNWTASFVFVLALSLGACATEPTQLEATFGDSVRHMMRAQTHDPATLESPSTETIDSADGQRLEKALEAYREGVTAPQQSGAGVTINVGGGG